MRFNVDPIIWGPAGWEFLEAIARGYPVSPSETDKTKAVAFFTSLGHLLPCMKCRDGHALFIKKYDPRRFVGSKHMLREWVELYKTHSNPFNARLEEVMDVL